MMTGGAITARQALDWGLLWRLLPEATLVDEAIRLGERPARVFPYCHKQLDDPSVGIRPREDKCEPPQPFLDTGALVPDHDVHECLLFKRNRKPCRDAAYSYRGHHLIAALRAWLFARRTRIKERTWTVRLFQFSQNNAKSQV